MSALTDLFSSMANKIRSKVGGSDTYTPTEMVSAIDDVYDAGIADATTDITPSDASPAAMLANLGYKPTTNGYAIESYKTVNPQTVIIDNIDTSKVYKFSQPGIIIDKFDKNIIPSNVNPASFSSADKCFMTDSGYAISRYDSVTPSSSPASVSSGDIVKIGGSGVIVDAIPTPASITPSDSSPASLTANTPVTPSANGYAIASNPTSLTPSNSSPATISSGTIYKASAGGKAVASVTDVTPSSTPTSVSADDIVHIGGSGKIVDAISDVTPDDSLPPELSSGSTYRMGGNGYAIKTAPIEVVPNDTTPPAVSRGDMIKVITNGGYLYKTQQSGAKIAQGTFVTNTTLTSGYKVTCGFKPKYICCVLDNGTTGGACVYNEDVSNSKYERSCGTVNTWVNFGATLQYLGFVSIDNDGFTIYTGSTWSLNSLTWRYFAVG